jgi:hypothetical protein
MLLCLQSLVVVVQLDVLELVKMKQGVVPSGGAAVITLVILGGQHRERLRFFLVSLPAQVRLLATDTEALKMTSIYVYIILDSQLHYPRLQNIASSTTPVHIHFLCVTPSVPLFFSEVPQFSPIFLCKVSQILYEIPIV